MSIETRQATVQDADLLLRVIDLASEGVLPAMWADYAPDGMDPTEIGRAMVLEDTGPFSHRAATVIERDGEAMGAMIAYPMSGETSDEPVPPAFEPLKALDAQMVGDWYINMFAILPEARGQGLGARLMAQAEAQAKAAGHSAIALIVAESNGSATGFYRTLGFTEQDRCPFDTSAYGAPPTEAILMVKAI